MDESQDDRTLLKARWNSCLETKSEAACAGLRARMALKTGEMGYWKLGDYTTGLAPHLIEGTPFASRAHTYGHKKYTGPAPRYRHGPAVTITSATTGLSDASTELPSTQF